MPEQGEAFEVIGVAAIDGTIVSMSIPNTSDVAKIADGDLLVIDEVRTSPVDVASGDITNASGTVGFTINGSVAVEAPNFSLETALVRDGQIIGTLAAISTAVPKYDTAEGASITVQTNDLIADGAARYFYIGSSNLAVSDWGSVNFTDTSLWKVAESTKSISVDLNAGVILDAADTLKLWPNGTASSEVAFAFDLLGVTSGDGVILSITNDALESFVSETTLRRENNGTFERIGTVTVWNNATKAMVVDLDDSITLSDTDALWIGSGDDSMILTSSTGLSQVVDIVITTVTNGSAKVDYQNANVSASGRNWWHGLPRCWRSGRSDRHHRGRWCSVHYCQS